LLLLSFAAERLAADIHTERHFAGASQQIQRTQHQRT